MTHFAPPPALECGRQIRAATESWVKGIGPLAGMAPLRPDGSVRPIGVHVEGTHLSVSWYEGNEQITDVVELPPPSQQRERLSREWPSLTITNPSAQPAWAWLWSLEGLTHKLSQWVSAHALPMTNGPLHLEGAWQEALALTNCGSLFQEPIPLVEIEARLTRLTPAATRFFGTGNPSLLNSLVIELARLRQAGAVEMKPPLPGRDGNLGQWTWDGYSDQQLLKRVRAIFVGALEGYQQLVQTWLPNFVSRLETSVSLPARLVAMIVPSRPEKGIHGESRVQWHWEPLPDGGTSEVDLRLLTEPEMVNVKDIYNRLCALRPKAASWISTSVRYKSDIFGACPITDLVYEWLLNDLGRTGWL